MRRFHLRRPVRRWPAHVPGAAVMRRFCFRFWPAMAMVYLVVAFLAFIGWREVVRAVKLWLIGAPAGLYPGRV